MDDDLRKSVVGILSKSSSHKYAGTGFFVADGLILTCAHVVDDARILNDKVVFTMGEDEKWQYANVIFTSDPNKADIAILKPVDIPETPPALPLIGSRKSNGHEFDSFGYPREGNGQGLHGDGQIQSWVRDGLDRDRLQISSDKITHGFSGGPIIDKQLGGVVGMVSKGFDFGLDKKLGEVAFAIPSEILQRAYPPLQPPIQWHFAHHYGDSPNFTGRDAEHKMLTEWLNGNQHTLFVLRALGGFGKSALAWHWLHNNVDKNVWKYAAWWSFYEGDASFENFLTDTLEYLGLYEASKIAPRQQVRLLLEKLQTERVLLVLDGFERTLRAFNGMNAAYQGDDGQTLNRECVSPAAEDFLRGLSATGLRSKILMTTRLRPHVLEMHDGGLQARCVGEELTALTLDDAHRFFQKEQIKATRAEVQAACTPYAYHPLSLNLLAGLIKKDYQYPYDIRAAQKYYLNRQIKNHKEHILKVAYETLPAEHQKLLSSIACFRSAMSYDALQATFPSPHLDNALRDLEERGLLQVSRPQSPNHQITQSLIFDLHPIVRRYAYDRLATNDRTHTHTLLIVYFEAAPKREKIEKLDDLAPVIELYHHMVNAGRLDEAAKLFRDRLHDATYYQFGAYQLIIELLLALFLLDGQSKPPRLKGESNQAWTLAVLANSYALSGQPRHAVALFEIAINLYEKIAEQKNLAMGLGNLAYVSQLETGALKQAEHNLHRSIDLSREIEDEFREAIGHQELGRTLFYHSAWQAAKQELAACIGYWKKSNNVQSLALCESYRALGHLLMARAAQSGNRSLAIDYLESARQQAEHVLELINENTRKRYPFERDYIRIYWLLGGACRALTAITGASAAEIATVETHLDEALSRCRAINLVENEANILLELAKLRHMQNETPEALRLAHEALVITERSEFVLQGADVHLFLAELALASHRLDGEQGTDKKLALRYAQKARRLATGWEMIDGVQVYDETGEYVYKVAYDEAGRLIERLKSEG